MWKNCWFLKLWGHLGGYSCTARDSPGLPFPLEYQIFKGYVSDVVWMRASVAYLYSHIKTPRKKESKKVRIDIPRALLTFLDPDMGK